MKTKNKNLTVLSRALRNNMTKEEKRLWYDFLKELPVTFNRQKIIGKYIVDFYCAGASLVIELDGSQHYCKTGLMRDADRNMYLQGLGLTVLHYSNCDIYENFEGVCADIMKHIPKLIEE